MLENKVGALDFNYDLFFFSIKICGSYAVSQNNLYSKI